MRHTVFTCDTCCMITEYDNSDNTSAVSIKSAGVHQFVYNKELCLACSSELYSMLKDFMRSKLFTTKAVIAVSNEVNNVPLLRVGKVELGQGID